ACGISLLNNGELNPLYTSSFGVGELILDAISNGAKYLIIGIGGTSTNDGGSGMLEAMGVKFFDKGKNEIFALNGEKINLIDSFNSDIFEKLVSDITLDIACDVDNPLLGPNGATLTFAPQKGANNNSCKLLEKGMFNFANIIENHFGKELRNIPGTGAAGGLGMCFLSFFNSYLKKGIDLVLDTLEFDSYLDNCDLVITGEGKMDSQTERGKVPLGILNRTLSKQIKTIAICGIKDSDFNNTLYNKIFPIVPRITSLEESLLNPEKYLTELIEYEVLPWLKKLEL
ncbi:MAG: glycerate kinase, partial [Clostridiales bacterium]|nr:glycerate kinase [Clostridiales bacterium]